jgi:hypothetical protein
MSDIDKDRASYRQTVIGYLIMQHNWEGEKAEKWLDHNFDYMEGMWGSSCPPERVAYYINNMKNET